MYLLRVLTNMSAEGNIKNDKPGALRVTAEGDIKKKSQGLCELLARRSPPDLGAGTDGGNIGRSFKTSKTES
jgi:hypothetical protein